MSFILDALKKVEEDKRRVGEPRGRESLAVGRARTWRRFQLVVMAAIALASAALTAATLLWWIGGAPEEGSPSAEAVPSRAERDSEAAAPLVLESPAVMEAPPVEEAPLEEVPAEAPVPDGGASKEPPSGASPDPAERAEEDLMPEEDTPMRPDAVTEVEVAPIRLVGRESTARGELMEEPEPGDPEGELPEHFPALVLQGTSVIDGQPVAVISDQRVFEGDRVEGALVLRIEERTVELEFEGRRFKITL